MNNLELFLKYENLCKNIKLFRKNLDLTQEQLAEICDLSVSYIKQIEACKEFKNISFVVLFKLSKGLEIELNELFLPYTINKK